MLETLLLATGPQIKLPWSGPGGKKLRKGNLDLGYFGIVTSEELFSRDAFANLVGASPSLGDRVTGVDGWYKFIVNRDRIIYIARTPLLSNVSWEELYRRRLVYGTDDLGVPPIVTPEYEPKNQFMLLSKREWLPYEERLTTWYLKPRSLMGYDEPVSDSDSDLDSEWSILKHVLSKQYGGTGKFDRDDDSGQKLGKHLMANRTADGMEVKIRGGLGFNDESVADIYDKNSTYLWRPVVELIVDGSKAFEPHSLSWEIPEVFSRNFIQWAETRLDGDLNEMAKYNLRDYNHSYLDKAKPQQSENVKKDILGVSLISAGLFTDDERGETVEPNRLFKTDTNQLMEMGSLSDNVKPDPFMVSNQYETGITNYWTTDLMQPHYLWGGLDTSSQQFISPADNVKPDSLMVSNHRETGTTNYQTTDLMQPHYLWGGLDTSSQQFISPADNVKRDAKFVSSIQYSTWFQLTPDTPVRLLDAWHEADVLIEDDGVSITQELPQVNSRLSIQELVPMSLDYDAFLVNNTYRLGDSDTDVLEAENFVLHWGLEDVKVDGTLGYLSTQGQLIIEKPGLTGHNLNHRLSEYSIFNQSQDYNYNTLFDNIRQNANDRIDLQAGLTRLYPGVSSWMNWRIEFDINKSNIDYEDGAKLTNRLLIPVTNSITTGYDNDFTNVDFVIQPLSKDSAAKGSTQTRGIIFLDIDPTKVDDRYIPDALGKSLEQTNLLHDTVVNDHVVGFKTTYVPVVDESTFQRAFNAYRGPDLSEEVWAMSKHSESLQKVSELDDYFLSTKDYSNDGNLFRGLKIVPKKYIPIDRQSEVHLDWTSDHNYGQQVTSTLWVRRDVTAYAPITQIDHMPTLASYDYLLDAGILQLSYATPVVKVHMNVTKSTLVSDREVSDVSSICPALTSALSVEMDKLKADAFASSTAILGGYTVVDNFEAIDNYLVYDTVERVIGDGHRASIVGAGLSATSPNELNHGDVVNEVSEFVTPPRGVHVVEAPPMLPVPTISTVAI